MRKYRYFYHYHRHGDKKLTVHFRGKCILTNKIECKVACESKFNKIQPKLIMRGFASEVKLVSNKVVIE
jgi:hypothetical protein